MTLQGQILDYIRNTKMAGVPLSMILLEIGTTISAEKASQSYCISYHGKEIKPLDEQVRQGRRKLILKAIQALIRNQKLKEIDSQGTRHYEIIKITPNILDITTKINDIERMMQALIRLESDDRADIQFCARTLRRIVGKEIL